MNKILHTHSKNRNASIELLRIMLIIMVIMGHFNGFVNDGRNVAREVSYANYFVVTWMMMFTSPAVDTFILISGYYMSGSLKRSWIKPIVLLFEVVVFNELKYFASVLKGGPFEASGFLRYLLPANYFVVLYSVVYILSHYVDYLYNAFDYKAYKRLTCVIVFIFSGISYFVNLVNLIFGVNLEGLSPVGLSGDERGFTLVHFMMMYILGGMIKKHLFSKGEKKLIKSSSLRWIFLVIVISLIMTAICLAFENGKTSIFHFMTGYNSPWVIVMSISLFRAFIDMKLHEKLSSLINFLSQSVFVTFLLNELILYAFEASCVIRPNPLVTVLMITGVGIAVYSICFPIYLCYNIFESLCLRILRKKVGEKGIEYD